MSRLVRCMWLFALLLCVGAAPLKRMADTRGDTVAVVVPQGVTLEHTQQLFDRDAANLLKEAELPPTRVVRLNVYAATPDDADAAREAIRRHFPADARPSISVVIGAMPRPELRVAVDAVIATDAPPRDPPLPIVFISGQAELVAKEPGEATARTLAKLRETLAFLGCETSDVLHARYFLTPMSAGGKVIGAFEAMQPRFVHRTAMVEWKSEVPVEIEMVAIAPKPAPADAPTLEYVTPPGMTASPLFARVVRVNRGDVIFIGDLYSDVAGDGALQVNSIFAQLQDVLKQTGSDLRHLVKATYYVSDDDASKQLNAIRPKFYDTARPPAASKAMVPAVGRRERSVSIDMIAVSNK